MAIPFLRCPEGAILRLGFASEDVAVVVKTVVVDPILGFSVNSPPILGFLFLVVGLNRMFTGGMGS